MNKKQSTMEKLKALFSTGEKLTPAEAIELASLATDNVELKFLNAVSGETNFNIEGDEVAEGVAIFEILEDGENGDVADGDYELTIDGFEPFTVTVAGGMITVVPEMVAKEAEETEMSDDSNMETKFKELMDAFDSMKLSAKKPESFKEEFEAFKTELRAENKKQISVEMSKIPAINQLLVDADFSKQDKEETKDLNAETISLYRTKKKK